MMNNNPSVKEILNRPDKGVETSQNVLTRLWRTILLNLSIGNERFNGLLSTYLRDPNNGIKDDPNARANNRGNLVKELGGSNITFAVFEKGLRVLGVEQYRLVVQIKRKDTYTEHEVHVVNNIQTGEPPEDLSNAKIIQPWEDVVVEERTIPPIKHHTPISNLRDIVIPTAESILERVEAEKNKKSS